MPSSRKISAHQTTSEREQPTLSPEDLTPVRPTPVIAANGVPVLRIAAWDKPGSRTSAWLWHGLSTRIGGLSRAYCAEDAPGEMNLGFTAHDDREIVARNRRLLVEAVTGNSETPLITLRQIHSSVLVVGSASTADRSAPWKGDGLMTNEPGLLLGVQTADCIPVLVADRKRRVVAAFHAGWRGTVKRIVESGVGRMRLEFGSRPEDLTAAIGPGVGPCCYAVGEEVLSSFESQFPYGRELFHEAHDADPAHSRASSLHIDLVEANRRQLLAAGLKPTAVHATGGCTSCMSHLFFSHRASGGHAGRMMSVIGVRPRKAGNSA